MKAIDAVLTPSTEVDRFRIKIWDKDDGDRVGYDNETSADDSTEPTMSIPRGEIVIHQAK